MDDKKKTQDKEEWSFQIDQKQVRQAEKKREGKQLEDLKKSKLAKKKITLEETFEGTNSRTDLKKVLEKEQDEELRKKNIARDKALSAPLLKRLAAYLVDVVFIGVIFYIIFQTSALKMILGEIKSFTGVDIIAQTQIFLTKDQPVKSTDLSKNGQPQTPKSDVSVEFKKTEFDFIYNRPDFSKSKSSMEYIRYLIIDFLSKNQIGLNVLTFYKVSIFILLYLVLFIFPVMFWGKTLGKKVLQLQVVNQDGGVIGWKRAFYREILGKWFLIFGIITIPFNKKRQSLYDMIFKTRVIVYDDRLFNKDKITRVS